MMVSRTAVAALAALALTMTTGALTTGAAQEPPTAEDVLLRLVSADSEIRRNARQDAIKLLRREHSPMTAEEIAALIEALVEVALAADIGVEAAYNDAGFALRSAVGGPGMYSDGLGRYLSADDAPGEPVPEAFDALVRIYETRVVRALAPGGEDPFLEAAFRDYARRKPTGHDTRFEHWHLYSALRDIFDADPGPDGRGWAYVLALFERSKPPCGPRGDDEPPDCTVGPGSAWCAAGSFLHMTGLGDARPWPGPDQARWRWLCEGRTGGSTPWNYFSDWSR